MTMLQDYQDRYPAMEVTHTPNYKRNSIGSWTHDAFVRKFSYANGRLYRRKDGKEMGWILKDGRRRMGDWYMSRWIFYYHAGWMPMGQSHHVDHVSGDPTDDRIENLQILPAGNNRRKGNTIEGRKRHHSSETTAKRLTTLKTNKSGLYDPAVQRKGSALGNSPESRAKAMETKKKNQRGCYDPATAKRWVDACATPEARKKAWETRRRNQRLREK